MLVEYMEEFIFINDDSIASGCSDLSDDLSFFQITFLKNLNLFGTQKIWAQIYNDFSLHSNAQYTVFTNEFGKNLKISWMASPTRFELVYPPWKGGVLGH